MPAPIALFIYNRPDHLGRLLDDLLACPGLDRSDIVVYGDGPKSNYDSESVEKARAVAVEKLGTSATYRYSECNIGLANSIVSGVSELCDRYGRVIVLEDDLRISTSFLTYMNRMLDHYNDSENVFQISGHIFDVPEFEQRPSALMLPFISTWGWATWKRAWTSFDTQAAGSEILRSNQSIRHKFNLQGNYDYATMLEEFKRGNNCSWGVRWYWSVFSKGGLVLYPPRTLVRNHGFDGSGTHGRGLLRKFRQGQNIEDKADFDLPIAELDKQALTIVGKTIRRINGGTIGRILDGIKRIRNS